MSDTETPPVLPPPEGYRVLPMTGGFIGANGPLHIRVEREPGTKTVRRVQLGFRVEPRHCNPMGNCHGGMLATFADMLMPFTAHRVTAAVRGRFLPTVSLQVDYLRGAALGDWVQGEAQVLRTTRSLVFMQGVVGVDGEPILRCSGVFKIGPVFAPHGGT